MALKCQNVKMTIFSKSDIISVFLQYNKQNFIHKKYILILKNKRCIH